MPGYNLMQVLAYKYFINLRKVSILGSLITGNHFWVYQIVIRIWVPQTNNMSYHTINKLLTNVNKPIKIMEETQIQIQINTNSILTIPVVPQGTLQKVTWTSEFLMYLKIIAALKNRERSSCIEFHFNISVSQYGFLMRISFNTE